MLLAASSLPSLKMAAEGARTRASRGEKSDRGRCRAGSPRPLLSRSHLSFGIPVALDLGFVGQLLHSPAMLLLCPARFFRANFYALGPQGDAQKLFSRN